MVDRLPDGEWWQAMIDCAVAQVPRLTAFKEITRFLDLRGRVEAMAPLRSGACRPRAVLLFQLRPRPVVAVLPTQLWATLREDW